MKKIMLLSGVLLAFVLVIETAFSQSKTEENAIANAVKTFAEAGDAQDVEALKAITHNSYRLVWNSGKDAPFIADKDAFLGQFEKKEWGGDQREVTVESIQLFDGINAVAKVVSDGKQAQMRSLFSLVKIEGQWKIIGELVNATFKG